MIGVDPGVRGGIAVLSLAGEIRFMAGFRPDQTEADLARVVNLAVDHDGVDPACCIEKVGYIRGDGGLGAFTFGKIYGLLRGLLLARRVTLYDVAPMVWQSKMECLTGGNKNVSKRRAVELFPNPPQPITHATADALLLAEYGRRRLALAL